MGSKQRTATSPVCLPPPPRGPAAAADAVGVRACRDVDIRILVLSTQVLPPRKACRWWTAGERTPSWLLAVK